MDENTRYVLNNTSHQDFDGHTEFARMTPDQRLSWLDEANAAYVELHALVKPSLRIAETDPPYGTPPK
ncbi:MAG: hypothetical protein GXY61_12240 [Lentisphaerae bacterium]|jgi:hypothetical protein|nr:hypothetical protein [Lentisphaerota bacterium]